VTTPSPSPAFSQLISIPAISVALSERAPARREPLAVWEAGIDQKLNDQTSHVSPLSLQLPNNSSAFSCPPNPFRTTGLFRDQ
jgi:hypothetical protein